EGGIRDKLVTGVQTCALPVCFRGYSGAELVAILSHHSRVEPVLLEHRHDAGERPAPRGRSGSKRVPSTPEAVRSEKLAAVFLARSEERRVGKRWSDRWSRARL